MRPMRYKIALLSLLSLPAMLLVAAGGAAAAPHVGVPSWARTESARARSRQDARA